MFTHTLLHTDGMSYHVNPIFHALHTLLYIYLGTTWCINVLFIRSTAYPYSLKICSLLLLMKKFIWATLISRQLGLICEGMEDVGVIRDTKGSPSSWRNTADVIFPMILFCCEPWFTCLWTTCVARISLLVTTWVYSEGWAIASVVKKLLDFSFSFRTFLCLIDVFSFILHQYQLVLSLMSHASKKWTASLKYCPDNVMQTQLKEHCHSVWVEMAIMIRFFSNLPMQVVLDYCTLLVHRRCTFQPLMALKDLPAFLKLNSILLWYTLLFMNLLHFFPSLCMDILLHGISGCFLIIRSSLGMPISTLWSSVFDIGLCIVGYSIFLL